VLILSKRISAPPILSNSDLDAEAVMGIPPTPACFLFSCKAKKVFMAPSRIEEQLLIAQTKPNTNKI